jgi:hypothetical protein
MRRDPIASSDRQRGWVGLIVLLLGVVIVAILMKTVLQEYGLTGNAGPASKATPIDHVSPDVTLTTPAPTNALERARGVEASVQQQAGDIAKRIDAAAK